MKWKTALISVLLVVMLALGSLVLAPVPVARAGVIPDAIAPSYFYMSVSAGAMSFSFGSSNVLNNQYNNAGTMRVSVDGHLSESTASLIFGGDYNSVKGSNWLGTGVYKFAGDGLNHTVTWSAGTMNYSSVTSSTAGGSFVVRFPATNQGTPSVPVTAAAFGVVPPLSVSLSGPSAIDLTSGGTWTATASGGTSPYTYTWLWGKAPPHWSGMVVHGTSASDTFSKVLTAGTWTVECTLTDSAGGSDMENINVSASVVAGSYVAHFARSGGHGEYMDVWVTDSMGELVTITGSTTTEFGQYGTDGTSFGWTAADSEAVQGVGYVWRWHMAMTVAGVTFPPSGDFWLHSEIHLAISGYNLLIMKHWTSTFAMAGGTTYGPTGDPFDPEIPPVPAAEQVPAAYKWLWDWVVKIFGYLFVPTTDQIQEMAVAISDSSFNPFNNTDGSPVSWPAPVSDLVLLQHENIGTVADVGIHVEDNAVFSTIRLGMKFMISFSIVMLVLGSL